MQTALDGEISGLERIAKAIKKDNGAGAKAAANWLCEQMEIAPERLGWRLAGETPPSHADMAELVAQDFGDSIRFNLEESRWLIWSGTRWRRANMAGDEVMPFIGDACNVEAGNNKKKKHQMGSQHYRNSVLSAARAIQRLQARNADLDMGDMFLATPAGDWNLETNTLETPRPERMMTLSTAVAPEDIPTPQIDDMLAFAFDGDAYMIEFFWRAFGSCLVRGNPDQVLFAITGAAGAGKSVIVDAFTSAMGEYAAPAPDELLVAKVGSHPVMQKIMVSGQRLVVVHEAPDTPLNADAVKRYTGDRQLNARGLYEGFSVSEITASIMTISNAPPRLDGSDEGLQRRVLNIDFPNPVPANKRDTKLSKLLEKEYPGLLYRAGCAFGQMKIAGGLRPPTSVQSTTKEMMRSNDSLSEFLEEGLNITGKPNDVIPMNDVYDAYIRFSGQGGMSRIAFARAIFRKDGNLTAGRKRIDGQQVRCLVGARLICDTFENTE